LPVVEECHLAAEALKGLGELRTDGAPADHGKTPGTRDQGKDRLVGEKACLQKPRDGGLCCPRPGGNDRAPIAKPGAIDLDGVTVHEAPLSQENVDPELLREALDR